MTMKLKTNWNLWIHDNKKNWALQSYIHLLSIDSFEDCYEYINNIDEFDIMRTNFFVMRGNIKPTWEDNHNRNGGACKFKFEKDFIEEWEELLIYTLNEDVLTNCSSVTGLSFNPKNNPKNSHVIIKLWNNDKEDISTKINPILQEKYKDISIKYDLHSPEF